MKKCFFILLTALLAFASCRQDVFAPEGGDVIDPSKLHFELTIEHPGGTKGVKSGWEDGDKVFLFISGNTSGYVIATFDGSQSQWLTGYTGTLNANELESSGTLSAVYLPYGNDASASFADSKWTFTEGTDTYYFYAQSVPYTVKTIDGNNVLYATVSMVSPGTYVQFFIPCPSAAGTVQLACNALRPAGFGSVSSTGEITAKTVGAEGSWINGYPDTLGGEEGYYLSGIPVENPGADYYFALHKADDSYADYYKNRTAIAAPNAYQLPAYSTWPAVSGSRYVSVAGARWKIMNAGASYPWAPGLTYAWSGVANAYDSNSEKLPDDSHWTALLDGSKASRISMNINGVDGYLFVSTTSSTNYLFLPRSTSSSVSYWSLEEGHYLWTPTNDGSPEVRSIDAPGTAHVRSLKNGPDKNWFRIIARENPITITRGYGTLQYSTDEGETWQSFSSSIQVGAGEMVCFRSTTTTWNNANGQAFSVSDHFSIAGDLKSLLVGEKFETSQEQVPSSFSFTDFFNALKNTSHNNLIDASALVISMPSLPSSSLKSFFDGCSNLIAGPAELPATSIASTCYRNMFKGCTSLSSAPIIQKATTHVDSGWYQQMFMGCSNLQEIVFLDDYAYALGNFKDWVKGVNPNGTFYKSSTMTTFPNPGDSSTPSGWTVRDAS